MNKPNKPSKPIEPKIPTKPDLYEAARKSVNTYYSNDSEISCDYILDELNKQHDMYRPALNTYKTDSLSGCHISIDSEGGCLTIYGSEQKILKHQGIIDYDNKKYEKQLNNYTAKMHSYKQKLKKYKLLLEQYNNDMIKYDEYEKNKKIEWAKDILKEEGLI